MQEQLQISDISGPKFKGAEVRICWPLVSALKLISGEIAQAHGDAVWRTRYFTIWTFMNPVIDI
jgi:hypothetical protein